MTQTASKTQVLLARLPVVLLIALIVLDVSWYGLSSEVRRHVWQLLRDRLTGPTGFRFVLQPMMAMVVALFAGIKDARSGRSPYLWTVLTHRNERAGRLQEGIVATGKIFLIAIALDVVYQIIELKAFYPTEALIVAILLAFIPYLILRGPVARLARRWQHDEAVEPHA